MVFSFGFGSGVIWEWAGVCIRPTLDFKVTYLSWL